MTILHLNLKKEWFEKIKSGEKTIEYREFKQYWYTRLNNRYYDIIIFKNGYQKNAPEIKSEWIKTEIIKNGIETDLKINKPVFAIHFKIKSEAE